MKRIWGGRVEALKNCRISALGEFVSLVTVTKVHPDESITKTNSNKRKILICILILRSDYSFSN